MPTTAMKLRTAALPLVWLLFACAMARDWWNDPFDPTLEGTHRYGHNSEGALVTGLVMTLVELAILVLVLRPWSYDRSWPRPLVALVLLVPWTFLSMLLSMHAGGIFMLHWLWLFVVLIAMFVTLVRSAIASARR